MDSHQIGRGLSDIGPIYRGPIFYQTGRGFGTAFTSIWRFLKPLVSASLDTVKSEALKTGVNVIQDLQNQKNLRESLKDNSRMAMKNLTSQALEGAKTRLQRGGRKKKYKKSATRKKSISLKTLRKSKHQPRVKKSQLRSLDIFS